MILSYLYYTLLLQISNIFQGDDDMKKRKPQSIIKNLGIALYYSFIK